MPTPRSGATCGGIGNKNLAAEAAWRGFQFDPLRLSFAIQGEMQL